MVPVFMVWRRRASSHQYPLCWKSLGRRSKPSINCLPNLLYLPNSGFFLRAVDSSRIEAPLIPPPSPRVPMVFTNLFGNPLVTQRTSPTLVARNHEAKPAQIPCTLADIESDDDTLWLFVLSRSTCPPSSKNYLNSFPVGKKY